METKYKILFILILICTIIIYTFDTQENIQEPIKTEIVEKIIRIEGIQTHSYNCTITAYSPCSTETDNTPYQTSLMDKPVAGWTCAVSHDLKKYLGNKVYIYQIGVFKVNDLMNKRYEKRIDLFMGKNEAIEFGRKDNQFVVFF
jgi:3D (Asp-Asp-Asp) domain-containing protein